MCGICGFVGIEEPGLIERMTASIVHRGPDDSGVFTARDSELGSVTLGHRRLSIIDLSGGHQPMTTPSGNCTMVFNGEIYNFAEIRDRLIARGLAFETHSDTEVLLRLYETEGPDALHQLNGMFALAIYDRTKNELFLARDRVGIKPLYYVELPGGKLLFASEAKALMRHDGWDREINPHAIHDYLGLRYVPGHSCIFKNVRRLGPGESLTFKNGKATLRKWWSPPQHEGGYPKSEGEYLEELGEIMERSVSRRMISDVPFGAYLSGGLDSSLTVALMAKLSDMPVQTFSVGFDYEHDELSEAAATAELLGCQHHEIACRAEDVALLPDVVYHADEPMGDAINIPMFKLAQEATKHVTVILTGEGADEIFGGYLFHKVMWAAQLYRSMVPSPLRRWVVQPLMSLTPASLMNIAFKYPAHLGKRGKQKALDYLEMIGEGTIDEGYRHLISLFDKRDTDSVYSDDFKERLQGSARLWTPPTDSQGSRFDQMLRLQFGHWLPDNMLMRNDKMSMSSSIEGRVPFLDHELIDFSFRLPRRHKIRGLTGKYLLRKLTEKVLPRDTANRKKMPFYVPIEKYFQQKAFVEMMDDLLSEESTRRRGIFQPQAVAQLRDSLHQNEFVLVKQAYSLMTLELWFRIFVDGGGNYEPSQSIGSGAASV